MKNLSFVPYVPDNRHNLIHWLSSETWSHYPHGSLDYETAQRYVDSGMFQCENRQSYWIEVDGWQIAGLIRLYRLDTDAPTFDLHLSRLFRGQGIGMAAVEWTTNFLFDQSPQIDSITVVTRSDNRQMRRLLRNAAYDESSYHPQMWYDDLGVCYDIVCYQISREKQQQLIYAP